MKYNQLKGAGIMKYYARNYFELTILSPEVPQAINNEFCMFFVLDGELTATYKEEEYLLTSQDILFLCPNHTILLSPVLNKPAKLVKLTFFERNFERAFFMKENPYISVEDEKFQNKFDLRRKIFNLIKEAFFDQRDRMIKSYYFSLTYELISNFSINNHSDSKKDNRISEILTEINQRYSEQLSLSEIAQNHFLSAPYLSRFFKNQMKTTFSEYLKDIRLNFAINDLKSTDWSITKIAYENGFPDASTFIQNFKKKYSLTPANFRQSQIIEKTISPKKSSINEHEEHLLDSEFIQMINDISTIYEKSPVIQREVELSAKTVRKKIKKTWQKMINLSYAEDILDTDMQEHIRLVQSEIGFKYGRIWGILSSEMLYEGNGINDFNFDKIDQILDFLMEVNLVPFLELTPKPKVIHKSVDEDIFFQPYSQKERTDEEWYNMLSKFIKHCINRYGSNVVESWYFEVSKLDTNISITYWFDGNRDLSEPYHQESAMKKYINFYKRIYLLIKQIVPKAKLGGNFYSVDTDDETVAIVANKFEEKKISYDFLSYVMFPQNYFDKTSSKNNEILNKKDFLFDMVQELSSKRKDTIFEKTPIIISEWNLTISNRNYINDSLFKNLYLLENHLFMDDKVEMIGYWMLSDVFGKSYDSHHILNGMTGLISKNGVCKPSYYGYKYLSKIGSELLQSDKNFIFSRSKEKSFQLLCYNKAELSHNYFMTEEYTKAIDHYLWFNPQPDIKIKYDITDIPNGMYRIKRYELSKKQGSIYDNWLSLGAIKDLRKDELLYLNQISVPKLVVEEIQVEDNHLIFATHLSLNEFQLIEIVKHY